jgi:hypothetical protein
MVFAWPRPLTLIGYCYPFKFLKPKGRSLKVVQGYLGGNFFVFLTVSIDPRNAWFFLATPLDADWLLLPLQIFEAQM